MKKLFKDFLFHLVGIVSLAWWPGIVMHLSLQAASHDLPYPIEIIVVTGLFWWWSNVYIITVTLWNCCFKKDLK